MRQRWVIFVRGEQDESAELYGIFSSRESAERKAATVNAIIEMLENAENYPDGTTAWAYVMPLRSATLSSSVIVNRAGVKA